MALEIMKDDVKIIQGLSDYPNQEEGLTAQEMKEKFDEAGVRLQQYLNGSVVPALNKKLDEDRLNEAVSDAVDLALQDFSPEKIGAAPDGYGLGGNGATFQFSEIDNIKKNGWYATSCPNTTMFGMTFHYAFMRVDVWDQNNCRQTMYPVSSLGVMFTRYCSSGTWQPWECINPPMTVVTEYRTTERYKGKPVYAQRIDFGAMPNTSSKMVFFTSSSNIDRVLSVTGSSSIGDTIPYKSDASDISICVAKGVTSTQNYVLIKTSNDQSARTAEAVVKYTLI